MFFQEEYGIRDVEGYLGLGDGYKSQGGGGLGCGLMGGGFGQKGRIGLFILSLVYFAEPVPLQSASCPFVNKGGELGYGLMGGGFGQSGRIALFIPRPLIYAEPVRLHTASCPSFNQGG